MLNDPVTAQYTHTLTVTTGGEYTCTVANNSACISTGGPATTVSWTRDNVDITGEQNETVLNDPETAQVHPHSDYIMYA